MANEGVISGLGDILVQESASAEYILLAADRNALPNHPAIIYGGDVLGSDSNVKKVKHIGLAGYDILASTAEAAAVANTALTTGSTNVTVSRFSKSYENSDLARIVDASNFLRAEGLAQDAIMSSAETLVSLMADVTDGFSQFVGTSGADLTIANFLSAINTLEAGNVQGPYLSILHAVQWGDLRAAMAAATGTQSYVPATQAQLALVGSGLKGSYFGVDIFVTNRVPTANAAADRAGAMFGRGAVVWADGGFAPEGDSNQLIINGKVLFERARTAKAGLTAYVTHRNLGVAKAIDAHGVSMITDA